MTQSTARREKHSTKKGRILLLEDHAALAGLRRDFLAAEGYEVVCCRSGEDAMLRLESEEFQVLVADALLTPAERWNGAARRAASAASSAAASATRSGTLAGMVSGFEVAGVAKRRGVPVILSSGWPVRMGTPELHNLGIDYLCPKPCSLHQLLYLVEDAVENAPGKPSSQRPAARQSAGLVRKAQYQSHGKKSDH
jgi:DNA-binding NtrC family response regulator